MAVKIRKKLIITKIFYPSVYTFSNNSFIEIIKISEIEIDSKSIFVVWHSEPEMKFVLDLNNGHTEEELIS